MMGRFDEFVYTLPKRYTEWGDMYANPRAYFNGNESLWNSNLRMGFSVIQHEGLTEFPHMHHAVEEYYMFSGADVTRFFDFDAEIEMWIGEDPDEMEKYVITRPTIVRIPPRMWHGPVNYKRVGKPVAFSAVYFDGELCKITRRIKGDGTVDYPYYGSSQKRCVFDKTKTCNACGRCVRDYNDDNGTFEGHPDLKFAYDWAKEIASSEPAPRSGKYDELFFEYPVEYHNYGEIYANPRGKFRGITQMPKCNFYGGFSVALKDTHMETPHIHHARDEYLWFIGSNLADPFDFDATIELYLGWSPDDMTKIVITEPTVVRVPPNMWHTPINFTNVKKPVAFFPVYPDGDWSKVVRKENERGEYEYIFEAASLRRCAFDHSKICCYCGKCKKGGGKTVGVYLYKNKPKGESKE
ncbi:MAG: hypothetical protein IKR95_06350 [Oscillospiraceae bacterium]|nr:hypothetical protein [Oscillospiraceae bacterium]